LENVVTAARHAERQRPADGAVFQVAVLSDIHLSPAGTPDGTWNNATRRSVSSQLLQAAAGETAAAGHQHIVVLGDISDDGAPEMIGAALSVIADAGMEAWAVPGNHAVTQYADALDIAAERVSGGVVLRHHPVRVNDFITLAGSPLTINDGGHTCETTNLPDVTAITSQILLWALAGTAQTCQLAGGRWRPAAGSGDDARPHTAIDAT
jgi:hypothetical protein